MTHDLPTAAVVADAVTVHYGEHLAVDRMSFVLPRGATSAIIGPNGSGKSTLLRAISGIHPPTSGSMSVLGHPAADRRGDVAHVMQATVVAEEVPLTVREIVRMGRYARRGPWRRLDRDDHRAVAVAMDRVAVADLADRHLRELSGGQRQRVYVAQGLAQGADVLLLDEPVTGLDLPSQERIRMVIEEEVAAGRTVVLTTHDVGTAASADHVLVLATHLVASGEPAAALTADALTHAYSGTVFRTADGEVILGDPHQHGAIEPHHH